MVLTGWAGQVSLGQIAFFAIGAVVGAKASIDYDVDLIVALLVAAVVGGARGGASWACRRCAARASTWR